MRQPRVGHYWMIDLRMKPVGSHHSMADMYHCTGSFGEDKAVGIMHLELSRIL